MMHRILVWIVLVGWIDVARAMHVDPPCEMQNSFFAFARVIVCKNNLLAALWWDNIRVENGDTILFTKDGKDYRLDPEHTEFVPYTPPQPGIASSPAKIAATPKAQGIGASGAISDTTGRFEYVAMGGSDAIGAYRVEPGTGERSDIPGAPFKSGKVPSAVVVHPSNKFLYATNAISSDIYVYRIDQNTGALTSAGTFATGPLPNSAAIHPSGRFLYVTCVSGGTALPTVVAYGIDAVTGALTPLGNPIATGNFPDSIIVDPKGRFVYLAASVQIEGFTVAANGTLVKMAGSPFPATTPRRLAIARSGKFLYTANGSADSLSGFAIDATTGALAPLPGSPFASRGANPSWIVPDSSGQYVLVANPGSLTGGTDSIAVYASDAGSGVLRPLPEAPFPSPTTATPDILAAMPVFRDSFAQVGVAYATTPFSALGDAPPFTWTLESGALPPGIALDGASGTLSGMPTTLGTFPFTLTVTDVLGGSQSRALFITINTKGTPSDVVPANARSLAIEYLHAGFGHYFVTAIPDEIDKLDTGVFVGWARTGQSFRMYAGPDAGLAPVCRFFTTAFPPTSSHFYAPRGLGCEGTLMDHNWQFEGDVFYTPLPDASGTCPGGASPVYRLYNNGQGGAPNHRFTTSAAIRAQMLAAGYLAEGSGVGVGMCSPN